MSAYLILGLMLGYFLAMFGVSYLAGRKADNAGFFIGNRSNHWLVVAVAMIGSGISGVTFVSVPGMVATGGMSYLQMALGFILGQAVIAFVLVPLFYRIKLFSIYEYLRDRFGITSYKTGAWLFFVSKMLGASVRIFLVTLTMQLLVFDPLGLPFLLNVLLTVTLVWLYTFFGGVKSVVSVDVLKTASLVLSVGLSIYFIAKGLSLDFSGLVRTVKGSEMSRMFFFDDANDRRFFWKQFLAGIFTMIATTGLDQDMMQRNLSINTAKDAAKNILVSSVFQFFIIALFLILGVMLYTYAGRMGITLPEKGDQVFPFLATSGYFPVGVGVLFIIGLVAAAFPAAGSALTALTTSFTLDILGAGKKDDGALTRTRQTVHAAMALLMGVCIFVLNALSNTSVIDAVYVLASYTYGPLLGLFAFGIFSERRVRDRWIPLVVLLAPVLCFLLDRNSETWFGGYRFGYEILILNALFTILGLLLISRGGKVSLQTSSAYE